MSESNLTLSDLIARVQYIADTTNSSLDTRVTAWLNDAQNKAIVGKRLLFMRTSTSISITAGTQQGSLPSDFDEMDICYDVANNQLLSFEEPYFLKAADPDGSTLGTTARTLTADYFKLPTAMSGSSSTSDIPNQYRAGILVPYALFRYFKYKDDSKANDFFKEFQIGVQELQEHNATTYRSEDAGFVMPSTSGRLRFFYPTHTTIQVYTASTSYNRPTLYRRG